MKINNMDDLNKLARVLPSFVIADIDKRISDWLAAGGKHDDPYIKQQFRYAERFVKGE